MCDKLFIKKITHLRNSFYGCPVNMFERQPCPFYDDIKSSFVFPFFVLQQWSGECHWQVCCVLCLVCLVMMKMTIIIIIIIIILKRASYELFHTNSLACVLCMVSHCTS